MATASPTAMHRSRSLHEMGDKTLIKAKPVTVSNRVLGASRCQQLLPWCSCASGLTPALRPQ